MQRRESFLRVSLLIIGVHLYVSRAFAQECQPTMDVCRFSLEVKRQLAMYDGKEKIISRNGKLYKCDGKSDQCTLNTADANIIVLDGDNVPVLSFNDSIPGPPIIVHEGQKVLVTVTNVELTEGVSVHWHGMEQRGSPYMDGVSRITQCPILPGETFTYEFTAFPAGTHWYHSHSGAQRANGLFGALIVKEKKPLYVYDEDVIMNVGDWHSENAQVGFMRMLTGYYIGNRKYETTQTLDGANFSALPWDSAIIEGLGANKGSRLEDPPKRWFNVESGKKYRFRMIGSGELYPLRVSIDNHRLLLVQTEGFPLRPKLVQSIIIHPGERYDFILHADQNIGNYWIRAHSLEVGKSSHFATSVLHYQGASTLRYPRSQAEDCSTSNLCYVANCPFPIYPTNSGNRCVNFNELENAANMTAPKFVKGRSKEIFLNFGFPGKDGKNPGSINGRSFLLPFAPALTQPKAADLLDCKESKQCGRDRICYCYSSLRIPPDETVQFVLTNLGTGGGWAHPIHLHGYAMHILKVGYATVNAQTGRIIRPTDDVKCLDAYCNVGQWATSGWGGDNITDLNLERPPLKDTILVPPGGYVVARIRSDNPGKWFLHCHIEIHLLDGMAMVIEQGSGPTPPKDFPRCGSPEYGAASKRQQVDGILVALVMALTILGEQLMLH